MKKLMSVAVLALALTACGSNDETETPEGNMLTSGEGMMKSTAKAPPMTSEGYLKLKPGLWTRTASAGANAAEDRICIDESVYKLIQPERDITKALGSDCGGNVQQDLSSDGIKFSASCGGQDVEGVMSGTDQALRTEIKAGGTDYVVESKWAGECPAGMTPGATK